MSYATEQEDFWAGEFGDDYVDRNSYKEIVARRLLLWSNILRNRGSIESVLEFGCNVGMNFHVLKMLLPKAKLHGIEINAKAASTASNIPGITVYNESIYDFSKKDIYDLTFTNGVLIHINPEKLPIVYEKLYTHSRHYILVSEYYNPTPVEVAYRGYANRLFKRDFAGEMMDMYPDLRLLDYGFCYHRDVNFPLGDNTWFLMEKQK